jgi:hypothetical protein
MTGPAAHLEHDLARARPRLLSLACDLVSGGDRTRTVPPDLTAAGLESLASMATAIAAELRGEPALR